MDSLPFYLYHQGTLLESFKQGAKRSELCFFKNDSGCSLDKTTSNLPFISMDLPYVGNKPENRRKLKPITILKASNGIGLA